MLGALQVLCHTEYGLETELLERALDEEQPKEALIQLIQEQVCTALTLLLA